MVADNIHEVIAQLDVIVDDARARQDPLGYFAAMYRAVTIRIKDDIAAGRFEDGPRMDRVDTTFANFYLRAYEQHRTGGTPSGPWSLAFDFARRSKAGVFQHLLLGMNAHINFDLAQAVFESDEDLPALRHDYDRINDVLTELLGPLQNKVESHIFGAPFVDFVLGQLDERFAGWEMAKARAHAWEHAQELDGAGSADERAKVIAHMDHYTQSIARRLLLPGGKSSTLWCVVQRLEKTDVRAIIASIESVG